MKLINLVLIFAFFTLETTIGQKVEPTMPRHYFQQKFIANEFLINSAKLVISDTIKLDSLFTCVKKSWQSYVKDSLSINNNLPIEVLNNLDAYSYYWTLLSITAQTDQKSEIEYHLFKNYMLPSLLNDYQFIKTNPSLSNLKLIWAGSLRNTLDFGVKYYNKSVTFKSFYQLCKNLNEQLHSFEKYDDETKLYAAKLLNFLHENEYEIETMNYFFNNQQDIAYSYLLTGLSTNKYPNYRVQPLGKTFLKYYLSNGESDNCLAILNNLFFNTTNDDLPRDTLSKWYNIVDPVNGRKIYSEALSKFSNNYFKTDKIMTVHLPQRWNMIFNRIPQEKIKNAKFILVDFWYSGCHACIEEVPELNELHAFLKDNQNIIFISINTDFPNTQKDSSNLFEGAKKHNIKFPIVSDNKQSDFAKQFNVTGYPSKFIINSKGQIIVKEDGSPITLPGFYDFINLNK